MDADDLVSAEDLWWSWAVLADEGRLPDGSTNELDHDEMVLTYRQGGSWVSLQRIAGGRAVMWGRVADSVHDAVRHRTDVLAGAPDWAATDAVWRSVRETPTGFLCWHSRDGWDSTTDRMFDGVVRLMLPLWGADPRLVEAARSGRTDSPLLVQARGEAHVATQGAIRRRLRDEIHRQMRDTPERPRRLSGRPALLVRWARIAEPPVGFEHVVRVEEGHVAPAHDVRLPEPMAASLANVLRELYRDEAGDESGAWLFARVRYDGMRIGLDRAFDSLPRWHRGAGPTLRTLSWEMGQRSPAWRPAWASLLPM